MKRYYNSYIVAPYVATIHTNIEISMLYSKVAGSNPAWRATMNYTVLIIEISILGGVFLYLKAYK